jgi:hypothetical protein
VICQYEGKSYRLFVDWLVEAYYLRIVLQLSHIPHFTTLQKFTERISGTLLGKIISSFIILTKIGQLFIGIDSSGFKATHASQYYAERAKLTRRRRKYIKLSLTADVVQQIICTIKIRIFQRCVDRKSPSALALSFIKNQKWLHNSTTNLYLTFSQVCSRCV